MYRFNSSCRYALVLLTLGAAQYGIADDAGDIYSPYATQVGDKRLLWGDTHLHTTLSLDARSFGVELDAETAFRFARGEQVRATHGEYVKLSRPLDFLVVSDHSDAMGTMSEIIRGNPDFIANDTVASWHERLTTAEGRDLLKARMEVMLALTKGTAPDFLFDPDFFREVWQDYLDTAEAFNEPGRFTTLIGYEWTSSPQGNNLHRNVLYRDGADKAGQLLPFTTADSDNPEDLWRWLQAYEDKTGGEVLAIAHNGNISNGLMFPETNPVTGEPLSGDYARTRARWEPLYEVTQIKGDGETHPFLSVNDEFADYETWDRANFDGQSKTESMFQYEYAREALKRGLLLGESLGTNPYQFGMIGSTDSHTALATGDEDNFFGKMSYLEPSANRWQDSLGEVGDFKVLGWEMAASGYAAVWATDNTRAAIFDAMKRRETYATTGPRMVVRFDAELGDQKVPMGGSLSAHESVAPVFSVSALKDPDGANLDRIQVVKGWVDASGETREFVYDVVWSGEREPDQDGKLPPVGNTVDVPTARYSNTIGAVELSADWQDPDFDARQPAFYYVRVLEIPTPRWTAYDAVRFDVQMDSKVPMITQERAYTSPIWFKPN